MRDSEPCCIVCGGLVANRQETLAHDEIPAWMSEFHVIHADADDGEMPVLSQMNIRTFDPDEFGPEEPHPFDAIIDGINGPEFIPLKRMLDFPIHAKCLELLRRQVAVPFDQHFIWRLWEVCRSMPFHEDMKLLDWDHLYGEIEFPLDEAYIEPNSPWGDGIVPRRIDFFTTPNPMAFATARAAQSIKRNRTTSAPNKELEYSLNGPILSTCSRAIGRDSFGETASLAV